MARSMTLEGMARRSRGGFWEGLADEISFSKSFEQRVFLMAKPRTSGQFSQANTFDTPRFV